MSLILVNWSEPRAETKINQFQQHDWKASSFNYEEWWVLYYDHWPYWTLIQALKEKKRADKKKKNARLKKPTKSITSCMADVALLHAGCRTVKWPLAWLNKELFPWAVWPLKAPNGQWGSSVGKSIHPPSPIPYLCCKVFQSLNSNPALTNSGFIVLKLPSREQS